jgi:hypothetical protein
LTDVAKKMTELLPVLPLLLLQLVQADHSTH